MEKAKLIDALRKKFLKDIVGAKYETERLHGGTLGDVQLVKGVAVDEDGRSVDFAVVWKTQKKWERYADPQSWCREYDLYTSDLGNSFRDGLSWPQCYYANLEEDSMELCLEYVEGVTGLDMTVDMYETAARELGRWQGRLALEQNKYIDGVTNLSRTGFLKANYLHYRSWDEVYDYIRDEKCELPQHLCQMMIDLDAEEKTVWDRIETLPVIFCHRDFWVTNIFCDDGHVRLIDWDTSGWGYLGEDMASLIADEAKIEIMIDCYDRSVQAYYGGFQEYVDISHVQDHCTYELILVMFGYRLVEWFKFAESQEEKEMALQTLEKIHVIGNRGE